MNDILQKLLPMQPLASVEGAKIDDLMYLIHAIMFALFIGWAAYFVFVLFRFNAKRNPKAVHTHAAHKISSAVEWVLVALEFLLLFAFSIPFWATYMASLPAGKKDVVEIRLVAQQFAWNIHYPGPDGRFGRASGRFLAENTMGLDPNDPDGKDDITTMNMIPVPLGKTILIHMTSKDVIHSFGVPAFRTKQDVIPGLNTMVWFTPTKLGEFEIACSQLCGLGHYRMRGIVVVMPPAEYQQWVQDQKGIHD